MKNYSRHFFITSFLLIFSLQFLFAQPLKVGVAGLSHDHAYGLMQQWKRGEVVIVGIAESDTVLINRYKQRYQVPDSLFYTNINQLLQHVHPDAVLAYNPIAEHIAVVRACAPKGISVMVEKPLATTVKDAREIEALVNRYNIQVLTNFETTWYASNQQAFRMVKQDGNVGLVKKMIVHTGHGGPKEIGCSKEFLAWLTDPVKNGGGAVMDFGCYGANLMTWLMDGVPPVSVTAITRQLKPAIYPNVDDDATILLEYANGATGIIEASWNWPFGIKDWEIFGDKSYLHALNGRELTGRTKDSIYQVSVQPPVYSSNLVYLADVLRGHVKPENDLSSLPNNLIVVRILDAARQSASQGKKIMLGK